MVPEGRTTKGQSPVLPDQPLTLHKPDHTNPAMGDALIQKFAKAHVAFEQALCNALQYARDAGETLLKLQIKTGRKGTELFDQIRSEAGVEVSDRSCYLYIRIASRWNQLKVVAGDDLSDITLSQAVKLLQVPKEDKPTKPKDKPTLTSSQPETKSAPNAAPNGSTNGLVEGETDAKPQEAPEAEKEKPINVQPPFDQPTKDRLATVFAQNGPAPTSLQAMTNFVIPNLKRVAEVPVEPTELPFLANAIQEALALIQQIRAKYGI